MELLGGLHSLRRRANAHVLAETDRGSHDRQAFGTPKHFLDKGLVDLHFVELEGAQITQTGVSGAEIVQGNSHPELAQLPEYEYVLFAVSEHHAFGDLEFETIGRQTRGSEGADDDRDQIDVLELNRRQIDCDTQI